MTDPAPSSSADIVEQHAAGQIGRREALGKLGRLGLGTAVASGLLGAASDANAAPKPKSRRPYRILAFCGGGIRGIASARMMMRLARAHPGLFAQADLLAGCSVGSNIISSLVARRTPAQIYQSMTTETVKFFDRPNLDPTRPAFSVDEVAEGQHELHPSNPRLRDLDQKVAMVSFNVKGGPRSTWQPLLFNNLSKSTNAGTRLIDAVVSSGAMPAEMGSWRGNIDGAFFNHDPSIAAIALAVNEGVDLADIALVCFGTGLMSNWISSDTSNWGAQQWENGIGNSADGTPSPLINGTDDPVLSAIMNGPTTDLTPSLVRLMLGNRYAYLNPTLDRYIPEDDTNPDDLAYLDSQASKISIAHASQVVRQYWPR